MSSSRTVLLTPATLLPGITECDWEGGEPEGGTFLPSTLRVTGVTSDNIFGLSAPPCSTPWGKEMPFGPSRFGRRYWVKVAQSLLSSSLGAQVLYIRDLDLVHSSACGWGDSCLYESHSGSDIRGSFAHGHKIHSQRHLFLDGGDILVFIFFSPLSHSQLI